MSKQPKEQKQVTYAVTPEGGARLLLSLPPLHIQTTRQEQPRSRTLASAPCFSCDGKDPSFAQTCGGIEGRTKHKAPLLHTIASWVWSSISVLLLIIYSVLCSLPHSFFSWLPASWADPEVDVGDGGCGLLGALPSRPRKRVAGLWK